MREVKKEPRNHTEGAKKEREGRRACGKRGMDLETLLSNGGGFSSRKDKDMR